MPADVNANSNLLSAEQNRMVHENVGRRTVPMAVAVCQVYMADPNPNQWSLSHTGAVVFSKDNPKKSYFLRLVDLEQSKVVWDQELFGQFAYKRSRPYFHMFQGDSCTVGLNFADEGEGSDFAAEVEKKIDQRQERKMAKQETTGLGRRSSTQQPSSNNKPNPPAGNKDVSGSSAGSFFSKNRENKSNSKKNTKAGKSKIRKLDISAPSNFQHLSHIGWDPVSGFDSNNIAPEWKRLFTAAGVTEEQMQDKDTAQFIINYVEQHGGIDKAVREIDAGNNPFGGSSSGPPPASSRGGPPPLPPSSRGGPPPPPPQTPPPGGSIGRGGPPPPPSSRHAAPPPPSSHAPGRPPPPVSGGAPPPPPPPPSGSGAMAPPPPPSGGAPSPPGPPPPPTSGGGGGGGGSRGGLLDSIRQGAALKKVEAGSGVEKEGDDGASGTDGGGGSGMAGALAKALADRSKVIHSDNEDEDFGDDGDDDDWD